MNTQEQFQHTTPLYWCTTLYKSVRVFTIRQANMSCWRGTHAQELDLKKPRSGREKKGKVEGRQDME